MSSLLRLSSLLCVGVLLGISFIPISSQAQNFPKRLVTPQRAEDAEDVHAADLDGDGDQDVLSASSGDDKIAWYENTSGSFSDQKVITTDAASARAVFAADLDGDNDQDVLSASSGDDKIAWYENTGGGSFSDQKVITTSIEDPQAIYATDLNGDQDIDIVFGSGGTFSDGKVAWIENNGSSFSSPNVITSNVSSVRSVFVSDVNGDQNQDILSASQGADKISWYENNGSSFSGQMVISTSLNGPWSVRTSDLDSDGDEDVVATGFGSGSNDGVISIFENQGGGSFGGELTIFEGERVAPSVELADLSGDGEADILVPLLNQNKVAWHQNEFNEGGTFGNQNKITPRQLVDGIQEILPADIDDDGSSDIISVSSGNNRIAWYNNMSNGSFGDQSIISDNSTGVSVGVGDINSDGDPDVVYHSEPSDEIVWKENNIPSGEPFGMERVVSSVNTNPNSISTSDVDSDGRKDVVASFSGTTGNRKIVWYRNMGGGSFGTENIVSDNINGPTDIKVIDIDNDNYKDIIS